MPNICLVKYHLNIQTQGKRKSLCDHWLFAVGYINKTELRPVSGRNKFYIIIATLFEIWNTRNNFAIL